MQRTFLIALGGLALAQGATAQEGGTTFNFGLKSGLTASDNWTMEDPAPGDSFQFNNTLSLGIDSATRDTAVSINLGADIHHTDIAGSDTSTGIADPYANARYTRTGPGSEFSISGDISISDQELDFSDSDGTRTDTQLGTSYSFGQDALFGGSLSASLSQSKYDNSTDDDDFTKSLSANLSFQVSPGLTIRPSVSHTQYEVGDPTTETTETRTYGLGATAVLNDVSNLSVNITDKTIDSSVEGESHALTGSISYTRTGQNSTHTFSASTDISNEGRRSDIGYQRSLQFARTQANYGIGAAKSSDGERTWTANLDITQPLARGSLGASMNRSFVTGVDGEETLVTDLGASFNQELSEVSGLDISLDYNVEDDTGGLESTDATASITYNRDVAEDWVMKAGFSHKLSDDDASPTIRSNTVFLTFERNWVASR